MSKNVQDPGIRYEYVIVKSVAFERVSNISNDSREIEINFEQSNVLNEEQSQLQVELFTHIKPSDNSFKIDVSFVALFKKEGEGMNLEKFASDHASAHIFPFMREFIASLTLRSGIGPLYLSPTNINKLIKDSEVKKAKISNKQRKN